MEKQVRLLFAIQCNTRNTYDTDVPDSYVFNAINKFHKTQGICCLMVSLKHECQETGSVLIYLHHFTDIIILIRDLFLLTYSPCGHYNSIRKLSFDLTQKLDGVIRIWTCVIETFPTNTLPQPTTAILRIHA